MTVPFMPQNTTTTSTMSDLRVLQNMNSPSGAPGGNGQSWVNGMNAVYTAQFAHNTTRAILDRVFAGPMVQAQGMAYNPMSLTQTMFQGSSSLANFRDNLYASRAMLGNVVSEYRFNQQSFVDRLTNQGTVKTEVLDAMKQLALYSGKLAENMHEAATNITTFAKATGQSAEMYARAFGAAALGTRGIASSDAQQDQLLANVLKMNGNNKLLIQPYLSAIEAFREITRQSGGVPTGENGTENAQLALNRMIGLNPSLYGDRPDIAVQHSQALLEIGRGPMLPIALELARQRGGTGRDGKDEITFENIFRDFENKETYLDVGIKEFLGRPENRGYREVFEFNRMMGANLGKTLEETGGRATEFTSATAEQVANMKIGMQRDADSSVTEVGRANAGATNQFMNATTEFAKAVTWFSKTVAEFQKSSPLGTAVAGSVADGLATGAGMWGMAKLFTMLTGTAGPAALGLGGTGTGAAGLARFGLPGVVTAASLWSGYKLLRAGQEGLGALDAQAGVRESEAIGRELAANQAAAVATRGRGGPLPGVGSRDISAMGDAYEVPARALMDYLQSRGHTVSIGSTFRDLERTDAIYAQQGRKKPYEGAGGHGAGHDMDITGTPAMYRDAMSWLRQNGYGFKDETRDNNHLHVSFKNLATVADNLKTTTAALGDTARVVQDSTARMGQAATAPSGRRAAPPRH